MQTGCFPQIAWSSTDPHLSILPAWHQWPGHKPDEDRTPPVYIMDAKTGQAMYSLSSTTLSACGDAFKAGKLLDCRFAFSWSPSGRFLLIHDRFNAAPLMSGATRSKQPRRLLLVDLHLDGIVLDTSLANTSRYTPESLPVIWHPGSGSLVMSSQVQVVGFKTKARFPYAHLPDPCVPHEHIQGRECSPFSPDGRWLLVETSRSDHSLGLCMVSSQTPLVYVWHRALATISKACWLSDAVIMVDLRDGRPNYLLSAITGCKMSTLDCMVRRVSALLPASPFCSVLTYPATGISSDVHVILDKMSGMRLWSQSTCSNIRPAYLAWSPTGCGYAYCGMDRRQHCAGEAWFVIGWASIVL